MPDIFLLRDNFFNSLKSLIPPENKFNFLLMSVTNSINLVSIPVLVPSRSTSLIINSEKLRSFKE